MQPDEIPPPPVPVTETGAPLCDECGAAVEHEQRYCVVCGAHRRHVGDPAARYLSEASARSRSTHAAATARRRPRSGGGARGLGVAVALALIPAAAVVGVLAGRSSNNDDGPLIQALAHQQAAAERAAATPAATKTVASVGSTAGAQHATHAGAAGHARKTAKTTKTAKTAKTTKHHGSTTAGNSTSTGPTAISTAPPSTAAKQQGAKVTQAVQHSKGKSYVNQQKNLPGVVVVP